MSLLVSDRIPARPAALAGAVLASLALAGSAAATPMTVTAQTLLTPPGGGLLTGYSPRTTGLDVGAPSASLNGQIVAFASNATDLGTTPPSGTTQIWLRNAQKGTTTLISRATKTTDSPLGDPGLGSSTHPSISADGRYVVFASKSTNLSPDDLDNTSDVYVRDTAANTTTLVSRASNASGGAAGNGDSTEPVISPDGRYVAFTSAATNLAGNDTNGQTDVFMRDLRRGVTYLLSVNKAGTASAGGASSGRAKMSVAAGGGTGSGGGTKSGSRRSRGSGSPVSWKPTVKAVGWMPFRSRGMRKTKPCLPSPPGGRGMPWYSRSATAWPIRLPDMKTSSRMRRFGWAAS